MVFRPPGRWGYLFLSRWQTFDTEGTGMNGRINVLVLGGEAREHAIVWALSRSSVVGEVHAVRESGHGGGSTHSGLSHKEEMLPIVERGYWAWWRVRRLLVAGIADASGAGSSCLWT